MYLTQNLINVWRRCKSKRGSNWIGYVFREKNVKNCGRMAKQNYLYSIGKQNLFKNAPDLFYFWTEVLVWVIVGPEPLKRAQHTQECLLARPLQSTEDDTNLLDVRSMGAYSTRLQECVQSHDVDGNGNPNLPANVVVNDFARTLHTTFRRWNDNGTANCCMFYAMYNTLSSAKQLAFANEKKRRNQKDGLSETGGEEKNCIIGLKKKERWIYSYRYVHIFTSPAQNG